MKINSPPTLDTWRPSSDTGGVTLGCPGWCHYPIITGESVIKAVNYPRPSADCAGLLGGLCNTALTLPQSPHPVCWDFHGGHQPAQVVGVTKVRWTSEYTATKAAAVKLTFVRRYLMENVLHLFFEYDGFVGFCLLISMMIAPNDSDYRH